VHPQRWRTGLRLKRNAGVSTVAHGGSRGMQHKKRYSPRSGATQSIPIAKTIPISISIMEIRLLFAGDISTIKSNKMER